MKTLFSLILMGILIACSKNTGEKSSQLKIEKTDRNIDTLWVTTPRDANFYMTGVSDKILNWGSGSGLSYKHGIVADSVEVFTVLSIKLL